MIRVLIADDHAIVRNGISRMLKDQEDIEIVGEAADGQETIQKVRETAPDVILLDISMPGMVAGHKHASKVAQDHLLFQWPQYNILYRCRCRNL